MRKIISVITFLLLTIFSTNLLAEPAVKYFEFTMKSEDHIPFLQVKSSAKDSMIVQTLSNETKTVSLWDIQKITKYKDPGSNGVDVGVKWIGPMAITFGIVGAFAGAVGSALSTVFNSAKPNMLELVGGGIVVGGVYGFGIGYLVGFCIPQEETDLSQVNEISQKKEMILKIISSSAQN
jgi:hypothetical protein